MTFLVCGEALYDVFLGDPGPLGLQLDARRGGSAYNLAIGLARLGRAVGLLTGVSTDALGDGLTGALAEEGVQTDFLRRRALPTTLALVSLGATGAARYTFYGAGAADRSITAADLPALDGLSGLAFGCFSMVTEPTGTSFLELARRAKGGPLVVLDPNVRTTVEPDLGRWRARVDAFAAVADVIKVSDEDLATLYPDAPVATLAEGWLERGAALVVVTRGAAGATAWTPHGSVDVGAAKRTVVDTVGAGDSFLAALVARLDETLGLQRDRLRALTPNDLARLLEFAATAAGHTCSRRGADLPRRADLERGDG